MRLRGGAVAGRGAEERQRGEEGKGRGEAGGVVHWAEIEKSGIGAAVFGAPLSAAVQHLPTILLFTRSTTKPFLLDR